MRWGRAEVIYGRYLEFCKSVKHTPMSMVEFLLQDVDYECCDCFVWPKGELVKTNDGAIGVTMGWDKIPKTGRSSTIFAVVVKTAKGVCYYQPDELQKADIPPEVLEYVKSTFQDKVHGKVDEAFKES